MSREWKPGDVAVTQFGRSIVDRGDRCAHPLGLHWHHVAGGWDPLDSHPGARPLVVIDVEDRKQVARLIRVLSTGQPLVGLDPTNRELVDDAWIRHTQAALREFANPTPPKPDEPTGLGAVIEDADGTRWVRTEGPPARITGCVWTSAFSTALPDRAVNRAWDDIAAVRVLSEGVPS